MSKKRRKDMPQNWVVKSILCECGREVPVVPNLKAMANAIETHAWEHFKKESDPARAADEFDRVWHVLMASLFNNICTPNP